MIMPDVKVFIGPPFSGKTGRIIEELSAVVNPFDYTFIGSQGEFVKFAADMASQRIGAINRSAFKTIDQFAVENVQKEKHLAFADRSLKLSILSTVVEEMASENLDLKEELRNEAKIVRHRSTIEKLLSLIDDIKTYMKEDEFANPETLRDLFISDVMRRMGEKFSAYRIFDSYDAYKMIANGEIQIKGKYLFVDGFYDFTPVVSAFFRRLISSFEKVFMTVTTGEIFSNGTKTILKSLDGFKANMVEMQFNGSQVAKGLFIDNGSGVKIFSFEKASDEIKWVAGKIKSMIMEGKNLSDFEIVVKSGDSKYINALQDKLDEYSIHGAYLGRQKLLKSTVVQQMMIPLRVVTGGYPQDLLLSMIMAGFAGEHTEFDLIYDLSHLKRGAMRLSKVGRSKDWTERLKNFMRYLDVKEKLLKEEREDLVDESALDEIKRLKGLVNSAKQTVEKLFFFLEQFEKAHKISDYSKAFDLAFNLLIESKRMDDEDHTALDEFRNLIWEMEGIFDFMGIEKLESSQYRYYLEMQIKDRTYIPDRNQAKVRISDLLTSRFNYVPVKIFVDFTDENYPTFQPNYFYNSIEEETHFGTNRILKRLSDDRLDFYTAMAHSDMTYITMPESTAEGVKILPSLYLSEMLSKFRIDVEKRPELLPMSVQEAVIAYSKASRWGYRCVDFEKKFGITISVNKDMILKMDENLQMCETLSKKPVSFYRFSTYKECPLRFFFSYVMDLPQNILYDLDLNSLELGIVYHNALRKLISGKGREHLKRLDDLTLSSEVESIVREELEKISFFEPEIFEINLLKLKGALLAYLYEIELNDDLDGQGRNIKKYRLYMVGNGESDQFIPYEFEISFGREGKMASVDGIEFAGRIDRVDRCASGYMIVDYKTKNPGEKDQLVLYAAMYEKTFNRPVLRATFSTVEDPKIKNVLERDEIIKMEDPLFSDIHKFIDDLKKGIFIPKPCKEICKSCDFNEICPVRWPDGTFKCPKKSS